MFRKILIPIVIAGTAITVATAASASAGRSDLAAAKHATAKFRELKVAEAAGYGLFVDAKGIACIDIPGMGGMGVHYANGPLVGDPAINATTPEALVYAPDESGHLRLAALEYVVLQGAWDALHSSRPSLFGQPFNFTPAGNRFGLPPYYSLHVWLFKHNPAGTFAMWNPKVSCGPGEHKGHSMAAMTDIG